MFGQKFAYPITGLSFESDLHIAAYAKVSSPVEVVPQFVVLDAVTYNIKSASVVPAPSVAGLNFAVSPG